MATFLGWKEKTEEEIREAQKPKIKAKLAKIEKNGAISIQYRPPIATVPQDWKYYFREQELAKLSAAGRKEREEEAKKLMHVKFISNQEELE